MFIYIGTKTSTPDHMPTINCWRPQSTTKLTNCLAVASAKYMCFDCSCVSHTQSS